MISWTFMLALAVVVAFAVLTFLFQARWRFSLEGVAVLALNAVLWVWSFASVFAGGHGAASKETAAETIGFVAVGISAVWLVSVYRRASRS